MAAQALGADTLVTCMTTLIVPPRLLSLFGRRAVNFHPTLLPAYRGPSPFQGLMLDGQGNRHGGLSLHVLTPGIDEGPVIAQKTLPLAQAGGDYWVWLAQHAAACRELAGSALPAYLSGRLEPVVQSAGSYRRVRDEAILGRGMSLQRARHTLALIGATDRCGVSVPGRTMPVSVQAIRRVLGPPTGEEPVLGRLTVSVDLADVRVQVWRTTPVDRIRHHLKLVGALRRLDQE